MLQPHFGASCMKKSLESNSTLVFSKLKLRTALDLTMIGSATILVASSEERGGITAARKGRKARIIFNGFIQCQKLNMYMMKSSLYTSFGITYRYVRKT